MQTEQELAHHSAIANMSNCFKCKEMTDVCYFIADNTASFIVEVM